MWRRRGCFRGGSSSGGGSSSCGRISFGRGSSSGRGSLSEEEREKLICSVGAKKHAAWKWTNQGLHPPPSLLPYANGCGLILAAASLISLLQERCRLGGDGGGEAKATQRVLGLEDFVVDDDEAERRAFELARRLS
jgi:hypothetical protein